MTDRIQMPFLGVVAATVLMPWLILLVGRGIVLLSVFWLLIALSLVGSVLMLWKNRRLAVVGFVGLLLTFFFMMIVPSFARGQ